MVYLEVENFGEWDCVIKEFQTPQDAIEHGKDKFPQNQWRVVDDDGYHKYSYDPMDLLQTLGTQDLERFQRSADFVAGTAQRREARDLRIAALEVERPIPWFDDEEEVYEVYDEKVDWKKEGF